MRASLIFIVNDVFYLADDRVVFAGNYATGAKMRGACELCVDGNAISKLSIAGEMLFPSKGTTDIAIYSFDNVEKENIDLSKEVVLRFIG